MELCTCARLIKSDNICKDSSPQHFELGDESMVSSGYLLKNNYYEYEALLRSMISCMQIYMLNMLKSERIVGHLGQNFSAVIFRKVGKK